MKTWLLLAVAVWLAVSWQAAAQDKFLVTPGPVTVASAKSLMVGGTLTLNNNANGGPLRRDGGCTVYQAPRL